MSVAVPLTRFKANPVRCYDKPHATLWTCLLAATLLIALPGVTHAQTLVDLGATAPTPGTYDIAQLSTAGNQTAPDGLNYYTDNQSVHAAGEPGQTFTTGSNSAGYVLASLSLKTAGLGSYSGISTAQAYYLHIYSVSGSSATLLQTYTSANFTFNDGDWLQWNGLSLPLAANKTYAWSFGRVSSSTGWEALAVATTNLYTGGEIGLFPISGGTITFGSSHSFDAVFDLGLAIQNVPFISQITVSPTNSVYAGAQVTFAATVLGSQPLLYQWLFNGGSGYRNIPGATSNVLAFTAALTNAGYYELIATNASGAVTSAPLALSVTLDSTPPVVLRGFNLGLTNVEVDFSKPLEPASATNLANYSFANGLAISAASLGTDNSSVVLTTAPLTYGSNYTLLVRGVRDLAVPPNTMVATAINISASPRQRILLDTSWRFQLGDPGDVTTNVTFYPEIPDLSKLTVWTGTNSETNLMLLRPDPVATQAGENVSFVQTNYNDSGWRQLDLPHDWAVELPFDPSADGNHGFKPVGSSGFGVNNIGWYRHTFTLPANFAGQAFWLELDGIYRNALIWLNGRCIGRDVSGYAPIAFDVTPNIIAGGTNVLVIRVDASRFEGWFYEGAGIYRHVWLTTESPIHVAQWGTYVATTSLIGSNATISVQTTVTNESNVSTANASLTSTILDANGNSATLVSSGLSVPAYEALVVTQTLAVANANLWSLQTPYMYKLTSALSNQNSTVDLYNTPFGIRTVRWDPANGVFINGQHVEIQGMCNHQDHAGVGSALPDRLQFYRIERLKEMGVTGDRTSHNAPTPALLDACDQLGMLVLDETRRCGMDPESLGQLQRMVLRDRNHPSVFCWSLANEEWSVQGNTNGTMVMSVEQNLVHSLDSTRLCTSADNGAYGPDGFFAVNDVKGFNYNLGSMDPYHSSNPGSNVVGTETASTVTDRGMYTNDSVNGYVAGYDIQNSNVGWGASGEVWWPFYAARPWASGGFCWTGFDYRGEPTPYGWPCINSHFGIIDVCGFPKDLFYYYQANWTLKPVLHLFPHWNWSTVGQPIVVWAFGNCQVVELFTNGVSVGRQVLNVQSHAEWDNVAYSPGTLMAVGYNNGVAVTTNTITTTGAPAQVALIPDRNTILADGRDVSVVTVQILDAQGRMVPVASNLVTFNISGGNIIGVGNGDPSSHQADKASQRSVFNGLAEVIVQSTSQPGNISLSASSAGLVSANLNITKTNSLPPPAAPAGVAAAPGNAQVAVSWDIVPGAGTYNLWRATTSGGPYTLVGANIGDVNLGCIDYGVTNMTRYFYVVTANGANANGTSVPSAEVNAVPSAFVTGLTGVFNNGQVVLNWNASPGVAYNVKRSTVIGGPYSTIAASLSTTSFNDTNLLNCQTYYYVVTMTNAGSESLPSAEVSVSVPGTLPPQFTSADIGAVGLPGSASYCGGQFTINGSGSDIWGTSDAFQFVYTYLPVSTNCDIRARVANVQNTSSNAKGAVMIRESLATNSSHAMTDVEPTAGIEFIWRNGTGASASASVVTGAPPAWVRLTRTNNTFTSYFSPDGSSWTQLGSPTTITMAVGAYVGLAVCAHNNAALTTSLIDNVSANFLAPNTPPVLGPLSNLTVNPGQVVDVSVRASDAESPPQNLIFSMQNLLQNSALTQINNTNALFTWRPGVANANSSNFISIKVADNGLPSLSATQSFSLFVNPLTLPTVSPVLAGNGQLQLQVNGQSGPDYSVQASTNLNGSNWFTIFTTNSPPSPFVWTDTNTAANPFLFYRLLLGP